MSQGLRLTGLGLLIGLGRALALTRFVSSWLFGIEVQDPATFTLTALFILVVTAGACLIPAWSATKIDPIQVPRQK